ncbi:MAG TPA: BTAD domain-containing putative transcriptional regulator [Stellaceae bacterium]|nr:BTAD domain-containing putative transcriptional regulator [Stellaceae bacterium]
MKSTLGPAEEYVAPYAGGWVPRALPRIYLVGAMRAVAPGGADFLPRGRKTRGLLACLCLAQGERISRSRLVGLLWDRSADAQARMSLRQSLSELNGIVNRHVSGLVEIGRDSVRIDVRKCWIDALAILDASADATADSSNLVQPYSERLLEDLDGITPAFDQWLAGERTRFEDRVRKILEAELDRLTEQNAKPEVRAAAARRLINFEPTHEGAVRSLMKAFAQMGDRAQAIREFERCRQALVTVLDLPPSEETTAVYEAIRVESPQIPSPALFAGPAGVEPSETAAAGLLAPPPARWNVEKQSDPAAPHEYDPGHERRREPSIAVLPFRNITGDPAHDFVAEGLVEDLIEALSRIPNFFVISRLSSLAFRSQDRHPREIGNVLGVRYVLSGSLRVLGDRLRLTIELTDTQLEAPLWFSRLDERFLDLFEVQDRLCEMIVQKVAPHLHAAEMKRIRVKRPDSLEAYDLFLRAQENMHNSSRPVFETSEALFEAALAKDPHYAAALAWRARWHVLRVGQGWSPDPAHDATQADHFARAAIECNSMEPMAFAVHGHVASYLYKDFDLAFRRFEAALRINANAAPAWMWSAAAQAWMGDGPRAIEEINKAMALSPYDPLMYAYSGNAGVAYLVDGQYERAIECALRSLRENRTYTSAYKQLAIALVLAGREDEARGTARRLLELEPGLTVASFRRRYPGSASSHAERFCDALARAGVPVSDQNDAITKRK